jgi:hypothetical protein
MLPTLLLAAVLAGSAVSAGNMNLVSNPGLESIDGPNPAGWAPLAMGVPAQFAVDNSVAHDGTQSVRIDATEVTRSYLRSNPIPVTAGEIVEISAWVKTRDVPPDQGTVILIAEFSRGDRKGEVGKVATADRSLEWQQLAGRVTIPSGCDSLRIRMGFSYSYGTTWWDDVRVSVLEPLVAQVKSDANRLYPATGSLPVILLNRAARTGSLDVTLTLAGEPFKTKVNLSGVPEQQVECPVRIRGRDKVGVTIALSDAATGDRLWCSPPSQMAVPPPLVMLPPIPTHWALEDGPPIIQVELELALDPAPQSPQSARIELLDEHSERVFMRDLTGVPRSGGLCVDVLPGRVPVGQYRLVVTIDDSAGPAVTAEQPWGVVSRSQASSRVNGEGYLEKGGKIVFPLGMFNNTARLKEEVEAGFNIVHFYNAARVRAGERPDDQRLADAMNQCLAAGMHALLMVPQGFATEHEWSAFTRRIRMFRNHPALLAWDEEEGVARGDMAIETLQRIRRILREEDPHHPLMVGDARDVIGRITDRGNMFPLGEMDLGMWWWYPFPLKPGPDAALHGQEASGGLLLEPPAFLTRRNTSKPIWVGVQAYKKPGAGGRYPTPVEYRAQAYLALIHGAQGLMWYGGSVTGGAFLNPQEAHWTELRQLVSELRDLSPLLVGPREGTAVQPADSTVAAATARTPNRRVLLAVNRGPDACQASFQIGASSATVVRVIGENREVSVPQGLLTDSFAPFGTHVYDLAP